MEYYSYSHMNLTAHTIREFTKTLSKKIFETFSANSQSEKHCSCFSYSSKLEFDIQSESPSVAKGVCGSTTMQIFQVQILAGAQSLSFFFKRN